MLEASGHASVFTKPGTGKASHFVSEDRRDTDGLTVRMSYATLGHSRARDKKSERPKRQRLMEF